MAGRLNFGISTNIGNVADPTAAQDAATKAYVDANSPGQSVPIISFTTLNGSNLVYSSTLLSEYTNATFLLVSLDGIVLQNSVGSTYYTLSGNNLTIVPFTPAGKILQVAPSFTGPGGGGGGGTGTVTSVTSALNALTFTNSNITPQLTVQNSSTPTTQYLRGDGTWAIPPGTATGLTSVGLQAPAAFTVSNTPLTANGNLALAWSTTGGLIPVANLGTGTASTSTFLRGDGSWAVPSGTGSGVTSLNGLQGVITLSSTNNSINFTPTGQSINSSVNTSKITETLSTSSATSGALTVDISTNSAFSVSNLSGATTVTVNGVNSILTSNNQTFVFTIISSQSLATNYINNIAVTGSTLNTRWLNNVAPTAGSASGGRDIYRFIIIKTGDTTFDVIASQGRY